MTPEQAAERYLVNYGKRLTAAAKDTADCVEKGQFKDLTDVNDHWVAASKQAREDSQQELVDSMNKFLGDERNKPATEAGPLFRQLQKGFEKRAK